MLQAVQDGVLQTMCHGATRP